MEAMILLLDTLAMGLLCLWLRQQENGVPKRQNKHLARALAVLAFRTGPDEAEQARIDRRLRQQRARGFGAPPATAPSPATPPTRRR